MTITKIVDKQKKTFDSLKGELGYTNPMQAPRLEKITVSVGTGKISEKQQVERIIDRLSRITGQKPVMTRAKKAISAFKTRRGQVIGYKVTLRGTRAYEFLDKVIHIALPRTRDFRGLSVNSIDKMGNCTIGIKEHTVFPETSDEDLKDVFGLAITLTTTAKTKKEAESFFRYLGLPFKRE